MRHAMSLLYHVHAVTSCNKLLNNCETSEKLSLWTPIVLCGGRGAELFKVKKRGHEYKSLRTAVFYIDKHYLQKVVCPYSESPAEDVEGGWEVLILSPRVCLLESPVSTLLLDKLHNIQKLHNIHNKTKNSIIDNNARGDRSGMKG